MADQPRTRAPRTTLGMERLEDRVTPALVAPRFDIPFAQGQLLIGAVPGQEQVALAQVAGTGLSAGTKFLGFGVYKVTLQAGVGVQQAVTAFTGKAGVQYAEPDYVMQYDAVPNDPRFAEQYYLNNTGQNGGTPGADIRVTGAWDLTTGTGETVVAVVDSGTDFTHEDIAPNLWRNPGEIAGNGVDDDNNGYVDDTIGWDFQDNDNTPDNNNVTHGSWVGGNVGARGNNGVGMSGVNQNVRLMILKLGDSPLVSRQVEAIAYALRNGAKISNHSYGGPGDGNATRASMTATNAAGHIFVAAAGNSAIDNDLNPRYPTNFSTEFDNVVSVAATDRNDRMASFSQWGLRSVTVGAPGVEILSTQPNNTYTLTDGTSFSAPITAGALALAWDYSPGSTYQEIIQAMKDSVDILPDLVGRTVTGGRINVEGMLSRLNSSTYATGAGAGGGAVVNLYRGSSGRPSAAFLAYDLGFTGGVRVATGDFNGDGVTDVVTVPGKGGAPHVKIYDGKTLGVIGSFFAFESAFTGGLYVTAGDVNGDGLADVVVAADAAGGPRVSVFRFDPTTAATAMIGNFFAYDPGFTGGVRLALGDFDGDGMNDIVTAAGNGGGPHVKVFSAPSVLAGSPTAVRSFIAGNAGDRSGLFVAAGDFDGDALADVVVSSGAGNAPSVRIYNGANLAPMTALSARFGAIPGLVVDDGLDLTATPNRRAFPLNLLPPTAVPTQLPTVGGGESPRTLNGYIYGVRVATHDVNNDGQVDLLLAAGPADSPDVTIINGKSYAEMRNFSAYQNFFYGGVFVGGSVPVPEDDPTA